MQVCAQAKVQYIRQYTVGDASKGCTRRTRELSLAGEKGGRGEAGGEESDNSRETHCGLGKFKNLRVSEGSCAGRETQRTSWREGLDVEGLYRGRTDLGQKGTGALDASAFGGSFAPEFLHLPTQGPSLPYVPKTHIPLSGASRARF